MPLQPLEPLQPLQPKENHVVITDIRMPFFSMIMFMVKWALASIPAIIIVGFIIMIVIVIGTALIGHK